MTDPAKPQPAPTGEGTVVLDLVVVDLMTRADAGVEKYGTLLRTNNGRDALVDAYQEALDLCMYLRQRIEEEKDHASEVRKLRAELSHVRGLYSDLCAAVDAKERDA